MAPASMTDNYALVGIEILFIRLTTIQLLAHRIGKCFALIGSHVLADFVEFIDSLQHASNDFITDSHQCTTTAHPLIILKPDRLYETAPGMGLINAGTDRQDYRVGFIIGPGFQLVLIKIILCPIITGHAQERLDRRL